MRLTLAESKSASLPRGGEKFSPSSAYLHPEKFFGYFKYAMLAALLVLGIYLLDLNFTGGSAMSSGPISSSHANFGDDCAKCHVTFGQVENAKCESCHEKYRGSWIVDRGSLKPTINNPPSTIFGSYSFQTHYSYRSDSLMRSRGARVKNEEQPCHACHAEHRGRGFKLAQVANAMCASCHFESFEHDHPDFHFARTSAADDSALKFTHIRHVAEVKKLLRATNNQQPATSNQCLYCHEQESDGKLFKPISFDRHCSSCHLQNALTPPIVSATEQTPGVYLPEDILMRNEVSALWARAANPNDFRVLDDGRLQKRVQHRDPWVLYHLAQNNNLLLANSGAALADDILFTSAVVNSPYAEREALAKLKYSLTFLRLTRDKELHQRIAQADSALRKLQYSNTPILQHSINPKLAPSSPLSARIAKPCLECHMLSGGEILWVNGEQELLRRANFDHRAHLVQRDCLGCHFKIDVEKVAPDTLLSKQRDRSSVLNLPEIATCRQCHAEEKATVDCMRCHEFHP